MCTDLGALALSQLDVLDNGEESAAVQQPQDGAHSSHSAAIDGTGDMPHSQLPASTVTPLLRRAGRLEPASQDGSQSSSASPTEVSAPSVATKHAVEDVPSAALLHAGGSGGRDTGSGRHASSGHHPDLTEPQAQVGRLLMVCV